MAEKKETVTVEEDVVQDEDVQEDGILRIHVTVSRTEELIINDLIAVEEGNIKAMRNMVAKFVVDGSREYVEEEDARSQAGKMTVKQLRSAIVDIKDKMGDSATKKGK